MNGAGPYQWKVNTGSNNEWLDLDRHLLQCWPGSMLPYVVITLHCVNIIFQKEHVQFMFHFTWYAAVPLLLRQSHFCNAMHLLRSHLTCVKVRLDEPLSVALGTHTDGWMAVTETRDAAKPVVFHQVEVARFTSGQIGQQFLYHCEVEIIFRDIKSYLHFL